MITLKEILGNTPEADLSLAVRENLEILVNKLNVIRQAWGRPMQVTSGFRSMEDHLRIYRQIAARKGIPFDPAKVPTRSRHLFGAAADIADSKRELQAFLLKNQDLLEKAGLWCEAFEATPTWVHFQTQAPASGRRFFKP